MPARLTIELIQERLAACNVQPQSEFQTQNAKILMQCTICRFEWVSRPTSVLSGHGCRMCAGRPPSPPRTHPRPEKKRERPARLTADVINARLVFRGIRLVGEYLHSQQPAQFECAHGHNFSYIVNSVLRGRNCPECRAKYGLNRGS